MPKKTLKIVKNTKNEAVVQVKANQKTLLENCKKVACNEIALSVSTSRAKRGNRVEKRITKVFDPFYQFNDTVKKEWEKYVVAVIKVERIKKEFNTKTKQWKNFREESYYVSTILLPARIFAKAIRGHWWIENKNHYVRDVAMNEDKSRIRINPDRFSTMRSFALNILRANGVKNVKRTLFENSLDINKLFQYRGLC